MGDHPDVVAVIPARWASTRFPGKPLTPILGRPMIEHVWERTLRARGVSRAVVATDDERIVAACQARGMTVELTSPHHATGTDRIAEVATRLGADYYVNVQGDEPILDPLAIERVVQALLTAHRERNIEVSTGYIQGATPEQEQSPSSVHLVPTVDGCVLTFSRLPVPMAFREPFERTVHVGLYAFTGAALHWFAGTPQGPVERAESIELLRFVEHGRRIVCLPIAPGSIGVDHPEDVARVEAVLRAHTA